MNYESVPRDLERNDLNIGKCVKTDNNASNIYMRTG